jgi:Cu(I)/Ag(I) efflux system protein CusF
MSKPSRYFAVTTAVLLTVLSPSTRAMSASRSAAVRTDKRSFQLIHVGHHHAAQASGVINSVNPEQHKINLSHGPIQAFGWPAMTMDFAVDPSIDLSALKAGMKVDFSVAKSADGSAIVEAAKPAADR